PRRSPIPPWKSYLGIRRTLITYGPLKVEEVRSVPGQKQLGIHIRALGVIVVPAPPIWYTVQSGEVIVASVIHDLLRIPISLANCLQFFCGQIVCVFANS